MNWDQVEGNWKQLMGNIKERWGKLTDDELMTIGGKRDKLAGVLQQKYGLAKDKAEDEIAEFERNLEASDDRTRRSA